MNARQKSIKKLKDAIKNKTLGMYQNDLDMCLYYHKETDSCCAVGLLLDAKENFDKDMRGNVNLIEGEEMISDILHNKLIENETGLTNDELIILQNLHDVVINESNIDTMPQFIEKFENYVNQLEE